jgi:hypothetical protein
MIQDGFRLAEFIEDASSSLQCLGPLHIVVVILHIAFTLHQTFFMFKLHKVSCTSIRRTYTTQYRKMKSTNYSKASVRRCGTGNAASQTELFSLASFVFQYHERTSRRRRAKDVDDVRCVQNNPSAYVSPQCLRRTFKAT